MVAEEHSQKSGKPMNIKRTTMLWLTFLALTLFVTSVQGARIKKVSERKTNAFLKQLEKDQQKAWSEFKKQMNLRQVAWVQPDNKEEECNVLAIGWEEKILASSKFYWDGECKDGYASGLGRSFVDSTQGLASWLEEFGDPGELSVNYYAHNYDMKTTRIGFQDYNEPNPIGLNGSTYGFQEGISKSDFSIAHSIFDPEKGAIYTMAISLSADFIRKSKFFSNGTGIMFDYSSDPTQQVRNAAYFFDNSRNIAIGYGVMVGQDGQVGHVSYKDGVSTWVKLPEEFVGHIAKLEKEIDAQLIKLNTYVQRGNLALEVYKRRTCSGDLDVDYMDSILYGQICLEAGDFTPYVDKIAKLKDLAQKRQETNAQLALKQKEIDARNRATYAQQKQAQQVANNQAMAIATQQSQAMLNNSMNMLNNMINSNSTTPALGSWGSSSLKKNNVAVCHKMGPIVSCRQ